MYFLGGRGAGAGEDPDSVRCNGRKGDEIKKGYDFMNLLWPNYKYRDSIRLCLLVVLQYFIIWSLNIKGYSPERINERPKRVA